MFGVRHAFESLLTLWKTWDLHGFVFASLILQIVLFILAPLRKRTSYWLLGVTIWSSYLLVPTAITRALVAFTSKSDPKSQQPYLYSLWAVFLMMHFGGPDTITALSAEDNNLWVRSCSDLTAQIFATSKVLVGVPILFIHWPRFVLPAILFVYVAGFIKASEKIMSFRKASLTVFQTSLVGGKPNPGPDYAGTVKEYSFYKEHRIPVKFEDIWLEAMPLNRSYEAAGGLVELNDDQIVQQAFYFYNKFRGMYIDMVFCCHDRAESRDIFLNLSPRSAFKVLEKELKFAYDAFYTKTHLLSDKGWVRRRWICFVLQLLAALMTFLWFKMTTHHFQPSERFITWGLIIWSLAADVLSFIFLYQSDWNAACSAKKASPRQSPRWRCLFDICSESNPQFNLINYCVDERSPILEKVFIGIGANDMVESCLYVSNKCFPVNLKGFIFQNLKDNSLIAENLDNWEELSSSRGSWTLRYLASRDLDPASFEPWIMNVEYDESLLIWHIATELCYETGPEPDNNDEHRKFSKFLSDYMVYLFYKQPQLMSEIAPMARVIFQDTCADAKRLFHRVKGSTSSSKEGKARVIFQYPCAQARRLFHWASGFTSRCYLPAEIKAGVIFHYLCAQAKRLFHWAMGFTSRSCLPTEIKAGVIFQYLCAQVKRLFHWDKGTEMKVKVHKEACDKIMQVRTDLASPREVKGEGMSVLFEACELAKHLLHLKKEKKLKHWELISQIWVEFLCYTATHTPGAAHASLLCQGQELVTLVRLLTLHVGTSSQFRKAKYNPRSELVLDA